ncbi:MAG: hypothetical protein JWR08_1732 [Enterovirga sp.]|jgi:uncharacterized membrane protein|nr:hypothetical protein [Enterovirga sp.]
MVRVVLSELLLFLLPFAGFGLLLLLQRRKLVAIESWSKSSVWLAMAGLVLVIASFVYTAVVADRPEAGFVPTHMENGQVVPGRFR